PIRLGLAGRDQTIGEIGKRHPNGGSGRRPLAVEAVAGRTRIIVELVSLGGGPPPPPPERPPTAGRRKRGAAAAAGGAPPPPPPPRVRCPFAFVTTTCKSAKSNVGEYERGESLATRQVWGRWADTLVRCGPEERKGGLDMQRSVLALVLLGLLVVPAAQAQKGPF